MFAEQCMWITFESELIYLFIYLDLGDGYVINDFNNLYSQKYKRLTS